MLFGRRLIVVKNENFVYYCLRWCSSGTTPLISCKNRKFNYRGEGVSKKGNIGLASDGWLHKKSRGDYFTINPKSLQDPEPNKTFADYSFAPEIVSILAEKNLKYPSIIQKQSFPSLFSGKNTIVAAETGCGKTFAYLLPVLQQLYDRKPFKDGSLNSPSAIIISPNRELAHQLAEVAAPFCEKLSLNLECMTGGHMKRVISHASVSDLDLVIASFGALSKMVTHKVYNVRNVQHVVLDEADTLLDDSFSEKVCHFLKKIPFPFKITPDSQGAQLTLVSATMPMYLSELISGFVDVKSMQRVSTDNLHKILPSVKQLFLRVGKNEKQIELLTRVKADYNRRTPVMIFTKDTPTCCWVSLFLNENGVKCINFTSRMSPELRTENYKLFKTGQYNVISCTDIGSRGLDTTRVKHVINYDFPLYTADYIHRCGRTGRLGSPAGCLVTNFVATKSDVSAVQKIETSIRKLKELPKVNGNITRLIYGNTLKEKVELPVVN